MKRLLCTLLFIGLPLPAAAARLLIPMDDSQTDHLKAYGVVFQGLEKGSKGEWLLNYRGGSFLLDYNQDNVNRCLLMGVAAEQVSEGQVADIYRQIEAGNMERVELEKAPSIAVYSPPSAQPWDDAVTLALTYAEIKYAIVWDEEVLAGALDDYDWLHCHHEDFTGQYGKFYAAFRNELWYQADVKTNEDMARRLGYMKVSDMKLEVAKAIYDYVRRGGFLFSMCSAPETIDIALAAEGVDISPSEFDGDPVDPNCQARLDYSKTFAFENFTVELNPLEYRHSDIDTYPDRQIRFLSPDEDYFFLFDFAAKLDPVPTMLVQDHTATVAGFMGQTTGFRKSLLKDFVTILGQPDNYDEVRYIHGNLGRGTFTFLSGHDPEDYRHMVHDPATDLALYKNSPGYRLILNNVLFPAAKRKERKT
ncbi:MAG TPA: asparagine synthetase B [candidate division Zixibacteria bacterium]|nr:asparagine synthetase B [candidate division Zixibacteria bacterium]MDD4916420.1 asparagine synthetase B [candidate division Zixibacteria bacterium]MDM7972559.1 asparagine synthetase B [candidate division Zixibacteria bacterium]HOD65655.1 asparagine synthetase B [candidate division Zixibacteria bacterium]HOZ07041.1 asparagine synthetase B [candidate division Zixibacteria bacterium]